MLFEECIFFKNIISKFELIILKYLDQVFLSDTKDKTKNKNFKRLFLY